MAEIRERSDEDMMNGIDRLKGQAKLVSSEILGINVTYSSPSGLTFDELVEFKKFCGSHLELGIKNGDINYIRAFYSMLKEVDKTWEKIRVSTIESIRAMATLEDTESVKAAVAYVISMTNAVDCCLNPNREIIDIEERKFT